MTQELNKEPLNEVDEADLDTMTATKETLEDYTLRFAPRSYRKWSTRVVGISALGGIAYLADFAIGANIGIAYGTTNALWGILIFAVVIMATGFPVAYYSARYNIDLDLVTRGSGFGYYGSVVTNVIFATFTFIFFALEGSIMAQGLQAGPRHTAVARLRGVDAHHLPAGDLRHESAVHTAGLDDAAVADPDGRAVRLPGGQPSGIGQRSSSPTRVRTASRAFDIGSTLLAAGVCLSLIAQIAEQNDYLRFMPPEDAGEQAQLVDLDVPGRPGLGHLRRHQADRRPVPRRLSDRQRRRRAPASPTSRCTSSWRSTRTSCRAGWP